MDSCNYEVTLAKRFGHYEVKLAEFCLNVGMPNRFSGNAG